MLRILEYSIYDLLRSRWMYIYFGFYFLLTMTLFWLSGNISGVILSLMNVVLVLVPLVSMVFGVTYFYNSKEFTQLLLAQPVRRKDIFLGQYIGVSSSLALCLLIGVGLPFIVYGIFATPQWSNYLTLLAAGVLLTFISPASRCGWPSATTTASVVWPLDLPVAVVCGNLRRDLPAVIVVVL